LPSRKIDPVTANHRDDGISKDADQLFWCLG
jgi:hypothetical protein